MRFKGRGLVQLTGRANYRRIGARLGLPLEEHPELAAEFPAALETALVYWSDRRLNQYADQDDSEMITRAINGGLNGYADRLRYLSIAKSIWGTGVDHIVDVNKMVQRPTLRLGDSGPAVVTLQEALARLEPLPSRLVADGHFGPRTEETLRLFQAIHGLKADGVAGARTWAAIDAALAEPPILPAITTPPVIGDQVEPSRPPPDLPDDYEPTEPAPTGGLFRAIAAAFRRLIGA